MEKKVLTPEEKKVLKSMFFRSHLEMCIRDRFRSYDILLKRW